MNCKPPSDAELARFIEAARLPTIGEAANLNRDRMSALYQRAKLAYDTYTTEAGDLHVMPFVSLWPRQISGWMAVVRALEPEEKRIS